MDPSLFTYARVAELAGVSERTVYRMFPTKEDLDRAYSSEAVMAAGVPPPDELAGVPDMIREITKIWSDRFGGVRVQEHEPESDVYPVSMEARRQRDADFLARLRTLIPDSAELPDRQLLALAAAIQSTYSIRTMAISAQRWGLTIEEAGQAHAWVLAALLDTVQLGHIEPWEVSE